MTKINQKMKESIKAILAKPEWKAVDAETIELQGKEVDEKISCSICRDECYLELIKGDLQLAMINITADCHGQLYKTAEKLVNELTGKFVEEQLAKFA